MVWPGGVALTVWRRQDEVVRQRWTTVLMTFGSALPDDGGLSEAQVVSLWGADRVNLKTCETRRAAAVNAVDAPPETMEADHGDRG